MTSMPLKWSEDDAEGQLTRVLSLLSTRDDVHVHDHDHDEHYHRDDAVDAVAEATEVIRTHDHVVCHLSHHII